MNKAFPYLVIGFVWLLIVNLIDHTGEFPLIDDWAYAHGVKDFLDDGLLKISDWVAMTQVAHLFMGVAWVKVFGFSLEHLREMTLLISFLGSFVFYWLTGYFSTRVTHRLVGTLIITVNPIWMYLSHTFMTDVPFTTLFLALILILIKIVYPKKEYLAHKAQEVQEDQRVHSAQGAEHSKEVDEGRGMRDEKEQRPTGERASGQAEGLFTGYRLPFTDNRSPLLPTSYFLLPLILVLSSILVLIRQTGLGLGFSFLLWVLLMDRDRRGRFWGLALALVGVQVSTLIGYEWFMASIDALSTRYHGASSLSWILGRPWWVVRAAYYVLIQLQYLGMFLLPLLPFVWMKWRSVGAGNYSRWAYMAAGVVVLGMGVAVGGDILMNPRYTHLMQYDTVGHVMTIDFTYERLEFSRNLYPLWVVLHGLGLVNVFMIVVVGSRKWGVVARSSPFTVHSEGIDEGRGMRDEGDKRLAGKQASGLAERQKTVNSKRITEGHFSAEGSESTDRAGGRDGGFMGRLPFSVYRLLKTQRAFDHPVTWIILILAGYTVFISIGQFVFDRYLILHLPLFVLLVLHLVQSSQVHFTKTVNSKRTTEGEQAGKRESGITIVYSSLGTDRSRDADEGRGTRDERVRGQAELAHKDQEDQEDQEVQETEESAGARDQSAGAREQRLENEVDGPFTVYRLPFTHSLIPNPLSLIFLTLSLLFSITGVHDSFKWNRVRFGAIEQLEAQGISPHQIDGGAEYNSWQRTGPIQPLRLNEKSWWYVDGDDYAIAHEEIPGYKRIAAFPFTRYYGLESDTLYIVQRK